MAQRLSFDKHKEGGKIKDLPIADLKRHDNNYRAHPPEQVERIAQSLQRYGQRKAVVIREDNNEIIAGHGVVLAAESLGWETVRCDVWSVTDDAEATAYLIDDNSLERFAEDDEAALGGLLLSLQETDALPVSFDEAELNALLEQSMTPGPFREGGDPQSRISEWKDVEGILTDSDAPAILDGIERVVVQFSGGKDSTAALIWAMKHAPDISITALYVDTGVEFPGMAAHVADVCEQCDVALRMIKSPDEWWTWLRNLGRWPSLLYRQCISTFIGKPFAANVADEYLAEGTLIVRGGRAQETVSTSTQTATSTLSGLENYRTYKPLWCAKKDVCEKLIDVAGLPVWEGYERGFVRTACWCCPCQCGPQARALQANYPGLADHIRRWETRIGPIVPDGASTAPYDFDALLQRGIKR